jgi:hypothetical protein
MSCRVDLTFLDLRTVPPLAALCLDALSPVARCVARPARPPSGAIDLRIRRLAPAILTSARRS